MAPSLYNVHLLAQKKIKATKLKVSLISTALSGEVTSTTKNNTGY